MRPIVFQKPVLVALLWGAVCLGALADPLRFFAVGDLPYWESEKDALAELLRAAALQHPPRFIVHVGDIKSGGRSCTDAQLNEIAALFRAQPVPVVYTPGDNEWADCHRFTAGGMDPLARLGRVREIFFDDPTVLRLSELSPARVDPAHPEIQYFALEGLLVASLHVVGSNNGLRGADPVAAAEVARRGQVNHELLQRVAVQARERGARALVLLFHADPQLERARPQQGFRPLRGHLLELMDAFPGPVLAIHGDGHRCRLDRPLIDPKTGVPYERFERVEVPGSPVIGGVRVTLSPGIPVEFEVAPVYALSLNSLQGGS